ncbi:MAG: PaeR7I family type II restriction endonuclease, partial [Candidatus Acidiferrales bacterium]
MALSPDLEKRLRQAIKHFWSTRETQAEKQGSKTGARDAGARTAVTGGRQMDGFVSLVRDYLCENGLPKTQVYCEKQIELPGWYRPEKKWDLLLIENGQFLAGIEFKSQVGSFGNNCNNRTEEAIGSACDLWAAYREGAFKPSARPWLGYLMLLQDAPGSSRPVRAQEPHFKVFPEFKSASYAK